jgi:hypothetical protein
LGILLAIFIWRYLKEYGFTKSSRRWS